ncbi:MAG: hypothetical protein EOP06_07000 [Proteobacteria bacterium]|nr:MAG: hypothetical protein EOP06_07000 [Pseudomonadota bacterium]
MRNFVVFLLLFFLSFSASANFASDERREPKPTYTRFFLKRFDHWFTSFDKLGFKMNQIEKDYVQEFISTANTFGIRKDLAFIRAVSFQASFDEKTQTRGPHRFLDLENRSQLAPLLIQALKARAPKFDVSFIKSFEHQGVGIAPADADIELLVWVEKLSDNEWVKERPVLASNLDPKVQSGVLILSLKDSKVTKVSVIQPGVKTEHVCGAALKSSQIDRVSTSTGTTPIYAWHLDQYEEQALTQTGREFGAVVRANMNLIPGVIDCESQRKFRFSYP